MNILRLLLIISIVTLSSCSWFGKDEEIVAEANKKDLSDEELYNAARTYFDEKSYKKAVENFQEIERLYPFSKLATKAQVMAAYSYYKDDEYDDAVNVIDSFIRLNPANPDTPYMYYLKALCYYNQIADVKRDQKITEQALESLSELVRRYPDTEYARDAKLKIDLVNDHLAGKEMEIGRFYLKDKKYIAAINRFRVVIDNYQTTSHTPEALYRMVESYLSLGILPEAQKNAAVLGHNYPDSKWYKYAYRLVAEGENSPKKGVGGSWFDMFEDDEGKKSEGLPRDDEKVDSWIKKLF